MNHKYPKGKNKGKQIVKTKVEGLSLNEKNFYCMINSHKIHGNGQRLPHHHKFYEVSATTTITSAGTIVPLVNVAQGNGVSARDGDEGMLEDLYLNLLIDAANADIVSRARAIIFQSYVNSALAALTVANVLQTSNVQSFYNYAESNQFQIVSDWAFSLSGTAAAPTSSSSYFWGGRVDIRKCRKSLQWAPASVNGSNQLFLLFISDSVIAPFPNITYNSRVMFTDVTN